MKLMSTSVSTFTGLKAAFKRDSPFLKPCGEVVYPSTIPKGTVVQLASLHNTDTIRLGRPGHIRTIEYTSDRTLEFTVS